MPTAPLATATADLIEVTRNSVLLRGVVPTVLMARVGRAAVASEQHYEREEPHDAGLQKRRHHVIGFTRTRFAFASASSP